MDGRFRRRGHGSAGTILAMALLGQAALAMWWDELGAQAAGPLSPAALQRAGAMQDSWCGLYMLDASVLASELSPPA
jgi:hypothetical protein